MCKLFEAPIDAQLPPPVPVLTCPISPTTASGSAAAKQAVGETLEAKATMAVTDARVPKARMDDNIHPHN